MPLELTARQAVASADYEQKLSDTPKLSRKQKVGRLEAILADKPNALRRIGQGMIGPIQIRLRYEGIVRNVLVEDTLERGPLMPYDILDDLGRAYVLNSTDAEVKITPFEGKQAFPQLFRIASFPRIRKEDLYFLRVNAVEYAQDETRQAIQKQEDARLILLLEQAVVNLGTALAAGTVGLAPTGGLPIGLAAGPAAAPNEHTVLLGAGNPLEPADFYSAVTQIEINQLEARRVLVPERHRLQVQGRGLLGRSDHELRRVPDPALDHRPAGRGLPDRRARVHRRHAGHVLARRRGEPPCGAVLQGMGPG
jgi:hypothetical protein